MPRYFYEVSIELLGGAPDCALCRCESPEAVAEVLAVLCRHTTGRAIHITPVLVEQTETPARAEWPERAL